MATIKRDTGVAITYPEDEYRVATDAASTRSAVSSPHAPRPLTQTSAPDPLLDAIRDPDMALLDDLPALEPLPEGPRRRAGRVAAPELAVAVEVDASEDAVLLVEQNGVYAWQFAEEAGQRPAATATRRTAQPVRRQLRFVVRPSPAGATPTPERGRRRGIASQFLYGRVKAWVLRITARVVVGRAMTFLERHVRRGLMVMTGQHPDSWHLIEDLQDLELPTDRAPRVLLFVHGTFSSTMGSFGMLGAFDWGRRFLEDLQGSYDAVVGFEHPTLSLDPLENATDLLKRLDCSGRQLHVDVVTFSRGGLVLRALVEHLLPTQPHRIEIGRVVFVGVPNAGTNLAEPEHWHDLLDLYTNLAVAASRVLQLVPQLTFGAKLLEEAITGLTSLVKYMAEHATAAEGVPGLAAQRPGGEFVKGLNQTQPGQPTVASSFYCAVTSHFQADAEQHPQELPAPFLATVAQRVSAGLFKGPSDLVVDTPSMTRIDPQDGSYLKDQLDFGTNPHVYHTVYFAQPQVIGALRRWLKLPPPPPPPGPLPPPAPHASISPPPVGGGRRRRPLVIPATRRRLAAGIVLPASINTDFVVMDAEDLVLNLRSTIRERAINPPDYVVVRRRHGGKLLHYAYGLEETLRYSAQVPETQSILDALNMHEYQASQESDLAFMPKIRPLGATGTPTSARTIVLENLRPIGVVPEFTPAFSTAELLAAVPIDFQGVMEGGELNDRTIGTFKMMRLSGVNLMEPWLDDFQLAASPPTGQERQEQQEQVQQQQQQQEQEQEQQEIRADDVRMDSADGERGERGGRGGRGRPSASGGRRRRRTAGAGAGRGGMGAGSPPPEEVAPEDKAAMPGPGLLHFLAEMDGEVVVDEPTTLMVMISRELLAAAEGRTGMTATAEADLQQTIDIEILPRTNLKLADAQRRRVQVQPPRSGYPVAESFDLLPTHAGVGEVWVIVRQSQLQLACLQLRVSIGNQRAGSARPVRAESGPEQSYVYQPLRQLRIFDRSAGEQLWFEYDLQLPDKGHIQTERYECKPFLADRDKYVSELYQAIEHRWVSSGQDVEVFAEELREFGASLFRNLFPEELQRRLWQLRDSLDSIQLISTEPFIPWELVHLRDPSAAGMPDDAHFLGLKGAVRWLHNNNCPTSIRVRPGRSRYVIPDYPDPADKLPGADDERKYLKSKLKAAAVPPHLPEVRSILRAPGSFDLLHFSCHGIAEPDRISHAMLNLQGRVEALTDERGATSDHVIPENLTAVTVEEISNFRDEDGNMPLVVLNACQAGRLGFTLTGTGGFAQAILRGGAGAFVGALWSVSDAPATTFGKAFYEALRSGATLAHASVAAREAARAGEDASWLAYVVYGYPHLTVQWS